MAITRTAWIDDDGTGTTGTVINNAEKTQLYDQIDAALGGASPPWIDTPYNAAHYSAAPPMTWTVSAGQVTNWSRIDGRVLYWSVTIGPSTTTGSPGLALNIVIPQGVIIQKATRAVVKLYTTATGWIDADLSMPQGGTAAAVSKFDGTPLPIDASLYLYFQVMIPTP